MSAPDSPALAGMSIGTVLELLRPDFPDVTISKIRFLEAEGLVTPQRAASGYRRFTAYDCARLRFILTAQRDHYLPLKVIRAQLDAQPDGELPPFGSPYGVPRLVSVADGDHVAVGAEASFGAGSDPAAVAPTRIRLSREDLLDRSGVDGDLLTALLKAGVITTGPGGLLRRTRCGDPAVCTGSRRLWRRAPASARLPFSSRPAVRSDRPNRRAGSQSRQGRRSRSRRRPGA